MRIRFYLNEKSRSKLVRDVRKKVDEQNQQEHFSRFGFDVQGLRFEQDEEGIYTVTDTFLGGLPSRLKGVPIRMVTLYDETPITGGCRRQHGAYRSDEAEGVVDSFGVRSSTEDGFGERNEERQRMRLIAPDLNSVVSLYKAIRDGSASPEGVWSNKPPEMQRIPNAMSEEEAPVVESPECGEESEAAVAN